MHDLFELLKLVVMAGVFVIVAVFSAYGGIEKPFSDEPRRIRKSKKNEELNEHRLDMKAVYEARIFELEQQVATLRKAIRESLKNDSL